MARSYGFPGFEYVTIPHPVASLGAGQVREPARDLVRILGVEYYTDQGWTDGLPVVPVTEFYLASFLAQAGRDPDDVLLDMPHLNRALTVRLAAINAFGLRPHELDQATQGTSAKYTACIAENEEQSPWPAMHTESGLDAAEATAGRSPGRAACLRFGVVARAHLAGGRAGGGPRGGPPPVVRVP